MEKYFMAHHIINFFKWTFKEFFVHPFVDVEIFLISQKDS